MKFQPENVFEAIQRYGHDLDYNPDAKSVWRPTDAVAGTQRKLEILRSRVELGVPLFHPYDNPECLRTSDGHPKKAAAIRVIKLVRHRGTLLSD